MYTYTYTSTHIRIHIHLHIALWTFCLLQDSQYLDTHGDTPLHVCARVGAVEACQPFCQFGEVSKTAVSFFNIHYYILDHMSQHKMKTHVSFLTFWCMQPGPIRKWSLHAQKHATCPRTILRWSNSRQPKCWELIGPIGLCNLVGCRFGEDSCWDPIKKIPPKPSWYCLVTMNWLFGETVINTAYLLWHFALFL